MIFKHCDIMLLKALGRLEKRDFRLSSLFGTPVDYNNRFFGATATERTETF